MSLDQAYGQPTETSDILELTTAIVAAHLSSRETDPTEIPNLIRTIHQTLINLSDETKPIMTRPATPAVPIDQSVQPDYIVCLEDGRHLRMLKRHLNTAYGMSLDEYKARWGLTGRLPNRCTKLFQTPQLNCQK
jgi:predicted transcriptional regulator